MSDSGRSALRDAFGPAAAVRRRRRPHVLGARGRARRAGPVRGRGDAAARAAHRTRRAGRAAGARGGDPGVAPASGRGRTARRPRSTRRPPASRVALVRRPVTDVAGTGAAAALGDALTGLAADAIGRWDAGTAERMLHRAAPWCGVGGRPDPPPVSRTAVRWWWVRAETSLLSGDADGAVRASGTARALADELGSSRHLLKSRLVHAVARAVAGGDAAGELDAVATDAGAAGLLPLRWAALLAAADTAGDTVADPDRAGGAGRTSGGGTGRPNGRHAGGVHDRYAESSDGRTESPTCGDAHDERRLPAVRPRRASARCGSQRGFRAHGAVPYVTTPFGA